MNIIKGVKTNMESCNKREELQELYQWYRFWSDPTGFIPTVQEGRAVNLKMHGNVIWAVETQTLWLLHDLTILLTSSSDLQIQLVLSYERENYKNPNIYCKNMSPVFQNLPYFVGFIHVNSRYCMKYDRLF